MLTAGKVHSNGAISSGRLPRGRRGLHERRLLERYHRKRDVRARDQLFEHYLPLARRLARRYQRPGEPLEDLVQVAALGLVKALERFEPERQTAFTSFAVPTILGELKRHFRDTGWAVRVPRSTQERVMRIGQVVSELSSQLGRSPAPAEIAEAIGSSTEEVLEAMEAAMAYDVTSLDSSVDDEGTLDNRLARIGIEDPHYELVEYGASIAPALERLSKRERRILEMRFIEDRTQSDIAAEVGISQMHVSRLLRRALAALRDGEALTAQS